MEKGQMKNIVVLKNLPSNLVDEAIVILKPNKVARKLEYIDKKETKETKEKSTKKQNEKDYIIREVESVISNYIDKIEEKEKNNKKFLKDQRHKTLQIYSIVATIGLILFLIF